MLVWKRENLWVNSKHWNGTSQIVGVSINMCWMLLEWIAALFFFLPSFQSFRKYEYFPCAEALCQLPKKSRGGRRWRALVCDLQSLMGRDQRRKGCEAHYKWALFHRSPENHCLPGHITQDPKEERRHHLTLTMDSLRNEQSLLNQKFTFFFS